MTMLGAFKSTLPLQGGYLWKVAPRLSVHQKARLRRRMKNVDRNIEVLFESLRNNNGTTGYKKIDYLQKNISKEHEMTPKDKYTTFDKKEKDYRKSVHRVPKWTKLSFRENPKYF